MDISKIEEASAMDDHTADPDNQANSATADSDIATADHNTVMEEPKIEKEVTTDSKMDQPLSDEIDRAIAQVEAKKQENANKESSLKPNGDDTPKENGENTAAGKKEPSQRVKEGQAWNNRSRDAGRAGNSKTFRNNVKTDFESQAESSDPVAIRKQVEFYFSDSNLLQDNFLFGKVQGHENVPIPISTIHSFKRMRHFQPFSAVVDALKDSSTLEVIDDNYVRRKVPLPERLKGKQMDEIKNVFLDSAMKRSIYAKGFGEEQPSTQFDIEAFFSEFGPTNSVRLRRTNYKLFKGSVFVEFDSEETQRKFLTTDPPPKWRGKDLLIKSKEQYCNDKVEDIKAGRIKPHTQPGRDDRDWKTRRDEDQRNGNKQRGGHRGFGSSRGGRGGGRGGHRRDRDDDKKQSRDLREVPKVATTADPEKEAGATNKPADTAVEDASVSMETEGAAVAPVSSKRAREDDEEAEAEQVSKKVDTKTTGS